MIMAKKVPKGAAFFLSTTVHPLPQKKCCHLKKYVFIWAYLCHLLSLSWKCYIVRKLRLWTFQWCCLFFVIVKKFLDFSCFLKMVLYVHNQDQYTSSHHISKMFCLYKVSMIICKKVKVSILMLPKSLSFVWL